MTASVDPPGAARVRVNSREVYNATGGYTITYYQFEVYDVAPGCSVTSYTWHREVDIYNKPHQTHTVLTYDQRHRTSSTLYPGDAAFQNSNLAEYYDPGEGTNNSTTQTVSDLVVHLSGTPPTNYTLTVVAVPPEGGTVTGGGTYSAGAPFTISATRTRNPAYSFMYWEGPDGETYETPTVSSTMPARNITYIAHFHLCTHLLVHDPDSDELVYHAANLIADF